jgi:uncharacterized protein
MPDTVVTVGLVSDTHGLLRPGVFDALAGCVVILHAGDVGDDEILDELSLIAPVHAVRGNTDASGNPRLPAEQEHVIGGVRIHVSHGHELGAPTPARLVAAYDADVVVYGHTHRQLVQQVGTQWVVNPGAAGPRRFDLVPSVARLRVQQGQVLGIDLVEL